MISPAFISHQPHLNWRIQSVSPFLHTAAHLLNDSCVRLISPVVYIFERETTGALSSHPFPCPVFAYMHNAWQHGIPKRGSNERALILVCAWRQCCPSWYLRSNYGLVPKQQWWGEVCGMCKTPRPPLSFLTMQSSKQKHDWVWTSPSQGSSVRENKWSLHYDRLSQRCCRKLCHFHL